MIKNLIAKISSKQKLLARWALWFFLVNALLWVLIATNYLSLLPKFSSIVALTWQARVLSFVFIISTFIGYFGLVAYGAWALIACLSAYRWSRWVFFLSIFLAGFLSLALIVDSLVYHLCHFHLWGIVWTIVSAGVASDVLLLSSYEWLLIVALAALIFIFELLIAWIMWRLVGRYASFKHAKSIAYIVFVSLFLSYVLLVKSYVAVQTKAEIVVSTQLINLEAQLIPFYNNLMGIFLPERQGYLKLQQRGGGAFLQLDKTAGKLNYPLHPLQCSRQTTKPNILIIVIDALRFEALNAGVMPQLSQFARQAWRFQNHYSAGNATGPGIFSLFYGIPYNYWTAMLQARQAPVLIQQLQKADYEMALYRSASMQYPAFNKTVFAGVPNLQLNTPGNRAYVRDQKITQQFGDFLKKRNPKRPFFGFLFYDALHNYCQNPTPYPQIFQPAIKLCNRSYLDEKSDPIPYLNRYYNAAHFVDALVGEVLNGLKARKLLDNTIVLITADHGEEFNDSHKNYWGHVSAYTNWQLHVPLILYRPKQPPRTIESLSTHYDVAPFFIKEVLGCQNPYVDYSVGSPLLSPQPMPFFIASSYIDYAILNDERVTRLYPQGNYAITTRAAEPLLGAKLNEHELRAAFQQLHRYFARNNQASAP